VDAGQAEFAGQHESGRACSDDQHLRVHAVSLR
jgi:hypothetical protein